MRRKPVFNRRRIQSSKKRRAREKREQRRKKIYLLSLQTLPPEKLEKIFKKVVNGEIELVGLREAPRQRIEPPRLLPLKEFV